jgi:hypothetical protein
MDNKGLMIGIPTRGLWQSRFGVCLAMLTANLVNNKVPFAVNSAETSCLSRSRQELMEGAKKLGFRHLLFLDDDMTFPASVYQDFLKHGKDVVAANCVTRSAKSPRFTAAADGFLLNSKEMTGLTKADKVGAAVMLLDMNAFQDDIGGLFEVPWDDEKKAYHGEDYTFCRKLKQRGTDIWIDHDVSKHIGHIGLYTFTADYADALMKQAQDNPEEMERV